MLKTIRRRAGAYTSPTLGWCLLLPLEWEVNNITKELPVRKNIRLGNFDYSNAGYYFITICTHNRQNLLCDLINVGQGPTPTQQWADVCSCRLLAAGEIAQTELLELTKRYDYIRIDKYVIMPNHVQAIIVVEQREETSPHKAGLGPRPTMMDIICAYKSITTKRHNRLFGTTGKTLWQSRFYDHIIRDESEYLLIWEYIDMNLAKWNEDCYYN